MGTRVYRYGCRAPVEGADLVERQFSLAHQYQHTLVEIERAARTVLNARRREIVGDVGAAEVEAFEAKQLVEAARADVKAHKAEHRTRHVPAELSAAVTHARIREKNARRKLKEVRAEARTNPDWIAEAHAIRERSKTMKKAARAACGVYWGTYQLVEAACERAFDDSAKRGKMPKFRRWTGDGQVSVQLTGGGIPASELMHGTDTRVHADMLPAWAWVSRQQRRNARTTLWLRVGSNGRSPVWAGFPMLMHRPLPTSGVIKRVTVTRRKVGLRFEWSAEFTVAVHDAEPSTNPGVFAMDIGWRLREDRSVRVAYWANSFGEHGEVTIPQDLLEKIEHARSLRAMQDRLLDGVKARVAAARRNGSAPEWFMRTTEFAHAWRSSVRVARLVERWRRERFDGDAEHFAAAEQWLRSWRHLYQWETDERRKALRRRKDIYRRMGGKAAWFGCPGGLEQVHARCACPARRRERSGASAAPSAGRRRSQ